MVIAVAGPYSSDDENQRRLNFIKLNKVAAELLELGYTPLIGVNAALPVIEQASLTNSYEAMMQISLAILKSCDGLLLVAESPGANKEKKQMEAWGKPIFYSIQELINCQ